MCLQSTSLNTKLLAISIFVAIALLIRLVGHEFEIYLPDLEIWIEEMGLFAPLGFIILFVVFVPILMPVDAFCFAAGLIFPFVTGELAIMVAT